MGKTTIAWADYTFNPWRGCTKVSPGCANCYAEKLSRRNPAVLGSWGKGKPRVIASESMWRQPMKWNNYRFRCPGCGHLNHSSSNICQADNCAKPADLFKLIRPRVFCASLADWLDDEVWFAWTARLLITIRLTPNLDWLLLTKRPENFRDRMAAVRKWANTEDGKSMVSRCEVASIIDEWSDNQPPPNVWIGVSAENQEMWDKRVPILMNIPARILFVSVEPMLEHIDMKGYFGRAPHWVIFGGESGAGARPCNVDWIRDGISQCRAAGVAPFVKQLGKFPIQFDRTSLTIVEEPLNLKDPKGGDPAEWPEDLRVQEWPL